MLFSYELNVTEPVIAVVRTNTTPYGDREIERSETERWRRQMQRIACFDVLVLMHVYVRDTAAGTSGNDS